MKMVKMLVADKNCVDQWKLPRINLPRGKDTKLCPWRVAEVITKNRINSNASDCGGNQPALMAEKRKI